MTPMPSRTFPKPLSESDRAEIRKMIQERQPPESAYAIWEEEKEARVILPVLCKWTESLRD